MILAIWQIDPEKDKLGVLFESFGRTCELQGSEEIDCGIYDRVFGPEVVNCDTLEEVYSVFNSDHRPPSHRGRSLSVSDVVEVIAPDGGSTFFYCDRIGWAPVAFDSAKTQERS